MHDHDPFRVLDNQLVERVKLKSSEEQSRLALYIAEQTIKYLNMQDERMNRALEALHGGKRGNTTELQSLSNLAEELDEKAFNAQDADDDAAYDQAFFKARAANALETAFYPDAPRAIAETLYNAFFALDSDLILLLKWIKDFEETQ